MTGTVANFFITWAEPCDQNLEQCLGTKQVFSNQSMKSMICYTNTYKFGTYFLQDYIWPCVSQDGILGNSFYLKKERGEKKERERESENCPDPSPNTTITVDKNNQQSSPRVPKSYWREAGSLSSRDSGMFILMKGRREDICNYDFSIRI